MVEDLTFVTSFYKIYEQLDESFLDNFLKFAKKGAPIILYLDSQCSSWESQLTVYSNVKVIYDIQFNDLLVTKLFPKAETTLPTSGNPKKDTYEYLVLMNSKLEWMTHAIQHAQTKNLAWIDFGMLKIVKNFEAAWTKLTQVHVPLEKVLIPGCYNHTDPHEAISMDAVHWRFCGGLIFGTTETIQKFHGLSTKKLEEFSAAKKLTWEVNIWSYIERQTLDFFQWYAADHNDSMFNFPIPKKVMVILMIKNESAIIKRCIERALTIADAIFVADTGSTDGTVELLCELLPTLPVPAKMVGHPWKNFGHNRTRSFQDAVEFCDELEWEKELTYGLLLDADMCFVMTDKFKKSDLTQNSYSIIQKSGSLEYYNTRFVKLAYPWKCVGVTHEYWDGSDTGKLKTVYIDDIGDGGAKADKFERDMRLLEEGLKEDPTNARYMFYLAQTYKDLKRLPEAIEMYKKRVLAGGWYEEVWFATYQIARLCHELGNITDMEYWGLKGWDFHKKRTENLYLLTRVFRERGENYKAWHYMKLGLTVPKTDDQLFIETDIYDHLFKYEKTILNYYIEPHRRTEALRELIEYYNAHGGHCYSNLQHYVDPVKATYQALDFKQIGDYVATSTSILRQPNNTYLLNIRYVNYRIQKDGSYMMMQDGNLSRDHHVRTRNFCLKVDHDFRALGPMEEMKPNFPQKHNVHIEGLEDVRVFQNDSGLQWIGTSMQFSHDGRIRQVTGAYDVPKNLFTDAVSLKVNTNSDCEKNWIPLGNGEFIYGWHPFRIGKQNGDMLEWSQKQDTPRFFEHMRGSSNVVEYNGALYCVTHVVMYTTPRKYYHHLVRLNKETRMPEAYTMPFYFKTNHIEYVLGIEVRDATLICTVSQNDCDPVLAKIKLDDLRFYSI